MDKKELKVSAKVGKRLSVGFSLAMTESEHHAILDEFGGYIYELYFSPPLGPQYHTRPEDHRLFQQPGVEQMFWRVLSRARDMGIKLCLTLNHIACTADDMITAAALIDARIGCDSIVTLRRHSATLKDTFPDLRLLVSFNDGVDSPKYVDKIDRDVFSGIIPGRSTLRNFALFRYMKAKGFDVKFMLNTGCSFGCELCLCKNCFRPRPAPNEKIGALVSWDERYALQTLMPWELHENGYLETPDIDLFKVCSRPSPYGYLRAVLTSYVFNKNTEMQTDLPYSHWALWARGNILPPHFKELNGEKIAAAKKKIWADEAYQTFARTTI